VLTYPEGTPYRMIIQHIANARYAMKNPDRKHWKVITGWRRSALIGVGFLFALLALPVLAQVGGGYDLTWNTIDGGGGTSSTGGAFSLGGTIGQPDAGSLSGGTYSLAGGFWPADASTPTASALLVGHVTWQGRPAQPNSVQQIPLTLTLHLQAGGPNLEYTGMTTDASGFFTASVPGLAGTYSWRVKSAQVGPSPPAYNPGWLATGGTVALTGAALTPAEMGLQMAGDSNNDNLVTSQDFIILKNTFGKSSGQVGYDNRADFTGDQIIGSTDFVLLKNNFGQGGVP
jgi:hypothetical protein